MVVKFNYAHIAAAGNLSVAPDNGGAVLGAVNINTGAANATFTIYDGTSASGTVVAVLDASTKTCHFFGVNCPNGIFCVLAVGNADVTVSYA